MTDYKYDSEQVPISCPKCNSDDIGGTENNWVTHEFEEKGFLCNACKFQWLESWRFESWEAIK